MDQNRKVIVNSFAGKKRGADTKKSIYEKFPMVDVNIVDDKSKKWIVLAKLKQPSIMIDDNEFAWEEQYRPKAIDDCILPDTIKQNLKKELRKYSVAGIIPEILDLNYLYVEIDTTAYYNSNFAQSSDFVKTSILTNITNYANSTELNRYGARFKYSKFQKIPKNCNDYLTSKKKCTLLLVRRMEQHSWGNPLVQNLRYRWPQ